VSEVFNAIFTTGSSHLTKTRKTKMSVLSFLLLLIFRKNIISPLSVLLVIYQRCWPSKCIFTWRVSEKCKFKSGVTNLYV